MPSSLVFAALAMAWIVVLVPMVARRRQEVRRTADSALAARVLHRGDATGVRVRHEEVPDMPAIDDGYDDEPTERRYRPGRGGFDPYAAELAARARYAFRQRIVVFLLLTALASGLLAAFALPILWWVHAGADLLLVGYLIYLRRQVRIEQEIRQRRIDRAARGRRTVQHRRTGQSHTAGMGDVVSGPDGAATGFDPATDHDGSPNAVSEPAPRLPQRPAAPPGTAIVDLDDEDPALHHLDAEAPAPYRRAVGE